jgi:chaperonin GroEL (HSP60 family)
MLQDLAVITGGQVVSEDLGLKLENLTEECFGTCAKIKVRAGNIPDSFIES